MKTDFERPTIGFLSTHFKPSVPSLVLGFTKKYIKKPKRKQVSFHVGFELPKISEEYQRDSRPGNGAQSGFTQKLLGLVLINQIPDRIPVRRHLRIKLLYF